MSDFLIIAHRGASGCWPENTLLAFAKALDAGAKWLELDVHLSADGELVVIHDETLQRTTNGNGRVSDFRYDELQQLDAGDGEKIPLLDEVLELALGRAAVNIELKGARTGSAVARLLEQRFAARQRLPKILASSLYEKELRELSAILPSLPLALVADTVDERTWQLAEELNLWSLNLNKASIDQALVVKAGTEKRKLLAFTVNEADKLEQLKNWGVNGVFTDFPERFA
ncbi:glycerophosphoryl diester phosphodiesterase [Malonomonas rubra DSM 5091]|uniref:Glycerophosphoryl diester phosphodiesterase n=1 Tax=Malonomonas rubra DSM 5091 TaxID=1122189 RepID=A0A1M6JSH2_MALRU|nr:glycerophosphodiester phosphodiesterase family protein [Malonomonas rubra]SHJ49687.1 glycerophosphoryl diester phosphodiesterase [Malonomonas rubra DSM 5091]